MTLGWWHCRWLPVTRSSLTQWCLSTKPALCPHCPPHNTTGSHWTVRCLGLSSSLFLPHYVFLCLFVSLWIPLSSSHCFPLSFSLILLPRLFLSHSRSRLFLSRSPNLSLFLSRSPSLSLSLTLCFPLSLSLSPCFPLFLYFPSLFLSISCSPSPCPSALGTSEVLSAGSS